MIVLGIDSSTDNLAVGLADEQRAIASKMLTAPRQHGSRIIGLIDQILTETSTAKNDLGGIAVAIGPGSFTGLRVGLATAKGLAIGLKISLVGISTFDVIAGRLKNEYPDFCLVAIARQGEFYFCRIETKATAGLKIELVSEHDLVERVGGVPIGFVTALPVSFEKSKFRAVPPERLLVSADELAKLGAKRIAAGKVDDPALLEPLYIAPAQAERRFSGR